MKYIAYCRKSTDTEDKQALSLESQESEIRKLAEANNFNIVEILRESKSAKEPGRPIFSQMMKMLSSGKADGILCWKIDRLTRNPIDGGQIQWLLQNSKIACIRSCERSYFPNDNVLLMGIEQAMANQYIRDLSSNVKRGNRTKLERGEWPNKAPFGYMNDKGTKKIVLDPVRSRYVPRAFELYTKGSHGFVEISEILHKEGLRTRSGGKMLKSHIQRILSCVFYTGTMERQGKYYRGNHQPLISKKIFDMAQDVMHGRAHPRPQRLFFPLRGFLVCETCGCGLTASLKKGHHYYYCTNSKRKCDEHKSYLRENYLYEEVAKLFEEIDFSERKIEIMYKAAQERVGLDSEYLEQTLRNHRAQLESLKSKESRLLDAFLAEQISKALYEEKALALQNERITLNQEISRLESSRPSLTLEPVKNLFLRASRAKKEFLEGDIFEKREILESLVWNLSIKDRIVAQKKFRSPYDIMAKVPKNAPISTLLADSS